MRFNRLIYGLRLTLVSLIVAANSGCGSEHAIDYPALPTRDSEVNFISSYPLPIEHESSYQFYSVVTGFSSTLSSFFESGRIESVNVVEGQIVEAGKVLATLYSPNLSEELMKAKASLVKAQAKFSFSQEDKSRGKELVAKGVISQQAYQQIIRAFDVDQQEVKEAAVLVEQLETQLANLQIVAKEAGVVGKLFKRVGDFIDAGQPMLRFESTSKLKASFLLPEKVALNIPLGRQASMYMPALDQHVDVVAIERALPTAGDAALHKVTFDIMNPQSVFVGLKAELSLALNKISAFHVDYRAVRYGPSGQAYVVKHAEELVKVPVTLVDLTPSAAVIAGEISVSDKLLLNSEITMPLNLGAL